MILVGGRLNISDWRVGGDESCVWLCVLWGREGGGVWRKRKGVVSWTVVGQRDHQPEQGVKEKRAAGWARCDNPTFSSPSRLATWFWQVESLSLNILTFEGVWQLLLPTHQAPDTLPLTPDLLKLALLPSLSLSLCLCVCAWNLPDSSLSLFSSPHTPLSLPFSMPPSSRIRVHVRLRPPTTNAHTSPSHHSQFPTSRLTLDLISNSITVRTPPPKGGAFQGNDEKTGLGTNYSTTNLHERGDSPSPSSPSIITFQYDQLHPPSTSQTSLYDISVSPLISTSLSGINATILTYGQTGSGKTYTTFGPPSGYDERGICARAIAEVFTAISKIKGASGNSNVAHAHHPKGTNVGVIGGGVAADIEVRISCLEIYNEHMYDLLGGFANGDVAHNGGGGNGGGGSSNGGNFTPPVLSLYEQPGSNGTNSTQVRNLFTPIITNTEEGLNYLFESQMNRAIAEHQLNEASSRSHCILTLHFFIRTKGRLVASSNGNNSRSQPDDGQIISSKLNIVDLAGSEKLDKTGAEGGTQKESGYINKSLSFLEQVVVALSTKSRDHIPYRQSKLTHVLKDSLGGNCETLMIACVWPSLEHMDQTTSTLKFAKRMMNVKNKPVVNESKGLMMGQGQNGKLLKSVKLLKEELAMHDTLAGRTGVLYDEPTEADREQMRKAIESFVKDESKVLEVLSIHHVRAMFGEMRTMIVDANGRKILTIEDGTPSKLQQQGQVCVLL